jgi:hypothetical protein
MSDLREHLQAIYEQRGRLTPDDVVLAARNPEHPLHNRFEWDDNAAAVAWRHSQAQELIRSVKVTYVDRAGVEQRTRAFVAVRQPLTDADGEPEINGGYRYLPAETVAKDELLARQALAEMEREWKTLRRKYDQFAEFWRLVRSEADEVPEAA